MEQNGTVCLTPMATQVVKIAFVALVRNFQTTMCNPTFHALRPFILKGDHVALYANNAVFTNLVSLQGLP